MSKSIKIENLWKQYEIGRKHDDTLGAAFRNLFSRSNKDTFWALRDINLEINTGDVVGIIGKNGAGKSTLLKLLSKITWPTKGRIEFEGRLASLLEVGTGFHQELTGRENIYLNGTILGMSKKEVAAKFDEIVWFSGVEKFIDTPVKHYSSGMYVRLAFAVAAHLEPEILVIDEVLAVGDAEFQKRCLSKMGEVSGSGRTVLFVSHNMGAIASLCKSCVVLKHGSLDFSGDTKPAIEHYLNGNSEYKEQLDLLKITREYLKTSPVLLSKFELRNGVNKSSRELKFGEPFSFSIECLANDQSTGFSLLIGISASNGQRVFTSLSDEAGGIYDIKKGVSLKVNANFGSTILLPGKYQVVVGIYRGKMGAIDLIEDVLSFEVLETTFTQEMAPYKGNYGYIRVNPDWIIE